jgi:hypothetical protein
LADLITWSARPAELRNNIIDAVHALKPDLRRRLVRDWERVSELTDEVGRDSIIRAFRDRRGELLEEFRRHESACDRALWLFLSKEADFKRAEEIAFARFYQGNKRYWNGFVVPSGLLLQRDEVRLARFGTGIRDTYATLDGSGDHVDIDLYEYEGSDVAQVSMYIADLSDVALEFEGPHLTSRERQLAREAAILYSAETGALDVIAPGGSAVRASLAALFIEHLLENEEALRETARFYRKDLWRDADCYVEIWLEKDALSGVLWPITSLYDVPLMVARGYASLSFLHGSAEYLNELDVPAYVYHLGDFDPSGVNAAEKIEETLRELAPDADIEFQRIAVTEEQIAFWDLPTRPTKKSDTRSKGFGDTSVELDAIEPEQLRTLVDDVIQTHLPPEQFAKLKIAEESERTIITDMVCAATQRRKPQSPNGQ